ncbi:ATP-binding protein [Tranquillimonas rosea]|uniref:sensor histidine kinase n=1 Tax=Tranquillimonas rosea TaxID=641238 RepID=UPI003BA9A492
MATGAVWLSAVVWIEYSTRSKVERVLDARLSEAARMVSSLMSDHRIEVARAGHAPVPVPLETGGGYSRQLHCQIWTLEGDLIGQSGGAPAERLSGAAETGFSRAVIDGEVWRVFTVVNEELGVRVSVGDSHAVRDRLIRSVVEAVLLPAAIVLPVLGALIWISVARGLAPLSQLADALRARSPSDLRPLPDGPAPREIRPVRRALNTLFERVERTRRAERDFTSFAAHELKTPLAGLRTQAQVAMMAEHPEDREAALRAIDQSVVRTDRLVRQLLDLTAVDRETDDAGPVALGAVAAQIADEARTRAAARGVSVVCADHAGGATVTGDAFLLQVAVRNVVENAIAASPEGGEVQVEVTKGADGPAVTVRDGGPGIPGDIRARVTERFYRGPAAAPGGSGLGLAIVSEAMERLGGRLEIAPPAPEGQGVALRFGVA